MNRSKMESRRIHIPLTLLALLMVTLIAVLAAAGLWVLRSLHGRQAHSSATRAVLHVGRLMASHLVDQPMIRNVSGSREDWSEFSRLVRSLRTLEDGLEYVSVTRDAVTVFHEQMSALDPAGKAGPAELDRQSPKEVRIGRRRLSVGDDVVPVVTFTADVIGDDGAVRSVEVGVRKSAVEREEAILAGAILSMYRLSLATVVAAFAICALVVLWVLKRERARELRRREEEHLAFAGVMANGIVHDFRNPMSSLRLDVQMLNREAARGAQASAGRLAELGGRALHALERMDKVFQEFFYLSRPAEKDRESIELAACARECVALLAPRFEQTGVEPRVEAPAAGVKVLAHPASLRRALVNVLTNAEQFSPAGGAVDVRVAAEGGRAVLDVMDRGPGISGADRKRIFEMFYSRRPGGTGLGLFLARTAVDRCGGQIRVLDRPGGGTCFRISLPLLETENREDPEWKTGKKSRTP